MWYPRKKEVFRQMEQSIGVPFTVYPDFEVFKFKTEQEVKYLGGNVGCFKHYHRVLTDLCNSDADYVGVFSDDLVYKKGWLDEAVKELKDGVGFVACYVPKGVRNRFNWSNGWHELKGGWDTAYGGGYLFRKDVAIELLKHPFIINHLNNYEANQQIDHAFPEAVHQMGLKQMFHVPSFINHIGISSTIGHLHTPDNVGAGW